MKRAEDNSYLERRCRVWWYNRRVPEKLAHLYTRGRIKQALGTTSLDQARRKRSLLAEADDHYWASLRMAEEDGQFSQLHLLMACPPLRMSKCARHLFGLSADFELTTVAVADARGT